jgi:predicted transcriptional regulator
MLGNALIAELLAVSQEGLSSMEVVIPTRQKRKQWQITSKGDKEFIQNFRHDTAGKGNIKLI